MGHFSVLNLEEVKDELGKIYESLSELCTNKDELVLCETRSTDEEDEIPKQNILKKNNIDDKRIVHPHNCHEKSILTGFGRPKTNGIFSRNRGD